MRRDVRAEVRDGNAARVRDLAKATGASASALYGQIARGELDSIRIGRVISVPNETARRLLGLDRPAA